MTKEAIVYWLREGGSMSELEAATVIEQQAKRIEELEKDKARLDWLETNANDTKGITVAGICYWSVEKGNKRISEGDDLRQAIDAAMNQK